MAALVAPLQVEHMALKEARDRYIIDQYSPGEGYEDEEWMATKVVSHRRTWDVEKLERLVPRGIFKNLVKMTVVPEKVDEYVRAKKIDRKKIEAAFTETPNAPYVKITKKSQPKVTGEDEADSLSAKF